MLEQGMAGVELHLLDQTKTREDETDTPGWEKDTTAKTKLFDDKLAQNELEGWDG
jgi:sulfite oxidase